MLQQLFLMNMQQRGFEGSESRKLKVSSLPSIVSTYTSLRSNIARSSSHLKSKGTQSNFTGTSSFSSAKAVAKEEVARLRLK